MTTATERYRLPRVDVTENEEAVTIQAEFPGVSRDDAEVEVRDGQLILKGRRHANDGDGRYRVRERSSGGYLRSFKLGEAIDSGKVQADLNDGVLTVTLPKVERLKPRAVTVN